MGSGRLEAFSDGVIAIIITIMVLEMKVPHGATLADLAPLLPVLLSYLLSFIYVAIYWNNHHHTLHATDIIDARIMWANMHLLFWLSLFPFVTGWMGENHFKPVPTALYGFVLMMAAFAFAFALLQRAIVARNGADSKLGIVLRRDFAGIASPILYLIAIPMAFYNQWISDALYVFVATLWIIPDKRIERNMNP